MRIWQLTAMAVVTLLGLIACDGGEYVYVTCVDQVTPEIPGLVVEGGGTFREGVISIVNGTGKDLYLLDKNEWEVIWVKSEGGVFYRSTGENTWEKGTSGKGVLYSRQGVAYYGPQPKKRGTVVSTWAIAGRVGDTPFEIQGRTVYKPKNWSCAP